MNVLTEVDAPRIADLRSNGEFFWIDLVSPSDEEVRRLGTALDLHPVALEDTLEFGQRPKIEPYMGHLLVVFFTARATGDRDAPAVPLEVHIYVAEGYVATVRREHCQALEDLYANMRAEHEADQLVYRVLDGLTDAFYPAINAVENEIDALEVELLARVRREHLGRSYRLKQSVRGLHRIATAQHEQFRTAHEVLLHVEGPARGTRPYLRDVGDHLAQIAGEFHRQLDDLMALTQTYYNANSDRLNAIASRVAVIGTVFVAWTVVTGFFGQNFEWLTGQIDSLTDFLLFGVGGLVVPTVILATVFWVKRDDWF